MVNKVLRAILKFLLIAVLILGAVYFSKYLDTNETLKYLVHESGYLGVLLAGVIGGLNFIIPVPAILFMPIFLSAGLNLWLVVLFITVGATLADSLSYIFGSVGRDIVVEPNSKLFNKLEEYKNKGKYYIYVILALFACFAPIPNEVLVAPLAFLGIKFKKILPIIFIGNFVFNALSALGISYFV